MPIKEKFTSLVFDENSGKENALINYVGIVSSLRGYQLCWHINRIGLIVLKRLDDVELYDHKSKTNYVVQQYFYEEPELERSVRLIAHRSTRGFLVKRMQNFDFFLELKNYVPDPQLLNSLRNIKQSSAYLLSAEEATPLSNAFTF